MKTPPPPPSVSYSFVMRLSYPNRIAMFARLTQTIGRLGGDLGAVDIVNPDAKRMAGLLSADILSFRCIDCFK